MCTQLCLGNQDNFQGKYLPYARESNSLPKSILYLKAEFDELSKTCMTQRSDIGHDAVVGRIQTYLSIYKSEPREGLKFTDKTETHTVTVTDMAQHILVENSNRSVHLKCIQGVR